MKKVVFILTFCLIFSGLYAQQSSLNIDKVKFFEDDSPLDVTLSMDIGKMLKTKTNPVYIPATFTCKMNDSLVSEEIRIIARGNVRREICYLPPIKLNFHNSTSPTFYPLNSLKLVCPCKSGNDYDQLILKEFLAYKIYNLLTPKSYRVRLLRINYEDAGNKRKTISQHAFLIEDAKAMAKRNSCSELKKVKVKSLYTDREQMTLVALFQYMIGNTDWGVSGNHNTSLIRSAADSSELPYVVPYDFDYCGLVNAVYAVPGEGLGVDEVTQRLYRGYPRSLEELKDALNIFNQQKEKIYYMINGFVALNSRARADVIYYLDEFYKTINNPVEVNHIFVVGAKTVSN
ncbi:MAG: hypothetical protein ABJB11_21675 [Ferruginibacter sp.]